MKSKTKIPSQKDLNIQCYRQIQVLSNQLHLVHIPIIIKYNFFINWVLALFFIEI